MSEAQRESLVLLIDTNPIAWENMIQLSISQFMEHLFVYLKQMILADQFLPPTVIAYNQCTAKFLYPMPSMAERSMEEAFQPTNVIQINQYFDSILENLREFNSSCVGMQIYLAPRVDLALSLALCHLNGFTNKTNPRRVLVFSVSEDKGSQYDNILFTAERVKATIDSFFLNNNQMCFLKQAADMTKGFSRKLGHPEHLVQYLLTLPSLMTRKNLSLRANEPMDYFAPSIDTKEMICMGYICPICLSVFKEYQEGKCPVCDSRIRVKSIITEWQKFDTKYFDKIVQ